MTFFNRNSARGRLWIAVTTAALMMVAAPGTWHGMNRVGSTGTVDESDMDEVHLKSGRAMIRRSVDSGKVVLRYDIQMSLHPSTIDVDLANILLVFRDNGPKARVIAKLKSYDARTGDTDLIATIDSDDFASSDEFQAQSANGDPTQPIDPAVSYFIEVQLIRSGRGGNPGVGVVGGYLREA